MQRIIAMICAMIFITALTSCTKNDEPITRTGDMPKPVLLSMTDGNGKFTEIPSYPPDAKTLPYRISNNTSEACHIVLIPKLERNLGLQFEDKWEEVPFKDDVGLCGTPYTIDGGKIYDGEVDLSNFNNLLEGRYRLSFENSDKTTTLFAEFNLQEETKETK